MAVRLEPVAIAELSNHNGAPAASIRRALQESGIHATDPATLHFTANDDPPLLLVTSSPTPTDGRSNPHARSYPTDRFRVRFPADLLEQTLEDSVDDLDGQDVLVYAGERVVAVGPVGTLDVAVDADALPDVSTSDAKP